MTYKSSKLIFTNRLPQVKPKTQILIYDQYLKTKYSHWIKKFDRSYGVESGEKLKDVKNFSKHIEEILLLAEGISKDKLQIVIFGGGSVGDFGGFVASILKRGVELIQIPSTWLAAIDSSHGGKTGLNSQNYKNQIGTFYPADQIYLVQEVLKAQPGERVFESLGEVYKMGLIQGGTLWQKISNIEVWDAHKLWKLLPALITAKVKIVKKDPLEKKGLRHVLNLGHTVGHVLEAASGLPHGYSVLLGTVFAINWGKKIGLTKPNLCLPFDQWILTQELSEVRRPEDFLAKDKKISGKNKIRYIFIKSPGKFLIKEVLLSDLLTEWKRQAQRA